MGIMFRYAYIQSFLALLDVFSIASLTWHAYDEKLVQNLLLNRSCDLFQKSTVAEIYGNDERNKYKLWPGKGCKAYFGRR